MRSRSYRDDDALDDVEPSGVRAINAKTSKAKRRKVCEGDIVAIPVGDDEYRLAAVLQRNRFGVALGLLEGRRGQRPPPASELIPEPHPVLLLVGLLDGRYRQTRASEDLEALLADGD